MLGRALPCHVKRILVGGFDSIAVVDFLVVNALQQQRRSGATAMTAKIISRTRTLSVRLGLAIPAFDRC
ncbi:MAG: hypothetical protein EXR03_04785 [Pseudolabrys sp.]|nr:hypothetical protein [Pseudolabrys sp.]